MTISQRDKRALAIFVPAVALILLYVYGPSSQQSNAVLAAPETVEMAEKRLASLRQQAALVPGKQEALSKVQSDLAAREKGILIADTPQQAQAQILQIMRRVLSSQQPPISITSTEIGQARPLDDSYGEVLASVSFSCRIEDLVNLLTDITKQKELIATSDIRIGGAHPKEKVMPVRLTVSGVVRRELIPDKKATGPTF